MMGLTRDQADLVRITGELTYVLGRAPTFEEIAHEYGATRSAVFDALDRIAERGWIDPDRRNGLRVILRLHPPQECDLELTERGRAAIATETPPAPEAA